MAPASSSIKDTDWSGHIPAVYSVYCLFRWEVFKMDLQHFSFQILAIKLPCKIIKQPVGISVKTVLEVGGILSKCTNIFKTKFKSAFYLAAVGISSPSCTLRAHEASPPWCPPELWCVMRRSGRSGRGSGWPAPARRGWLWTEDSPGDKHSHDSEMDTRWYPAKRQTLH